MSPPCVTHRGLFYSFSFLFLPKSPRFYALQHILVLIFRIVRNFPHFYLAVPNILLIFATANKTIVDYPAGRPFRLWLLAAGFFYAKEYHFPTGEFYFPNWENEYGGCMNRKI